MPREGHWRAVALAAETLRKAIEAGGLAGKGLGDSFPHNNGTFVQESPRPFRSGQRVR